MFQIKSVLISDDIDKKCVEILQNNGVHVELNPKLSKDKQQLVKEIEKYDALLVRSATKVTAEVLQAGKNLKLVGRAGTGVDNIDVPQATRQGVVVMNTPAGNSRSAAELTCAMVMCLARQLPQAHVSMKQGRWDRKLYMGSEVYGKTLAIIGLGRIGRDVATRMQAFGMKTIGFDPLVSAEDAAKFGVTSMCLDELWPLADYITVHVPLIPSTKNLLNAETLSRCKKGVRLVNCARGGIINETDLLVALDNGHVAGAAFDVYDQEPPTNRALVDHAKVICTPHLGASTREAQDRVASEIAENIVALNQGTALLGALNAAPLTALLEPQNAKWLKTVEDLTLLLQALNGNKLKQFSVTVPKELQNIKKGLKAACVIGSLKATSQNGLNVINAEMCAKDAGVEVSIEDAAADSDSVLAVHSGKNSVQGTATGAGTLVTHINHTATTVLCSNTLAVVNKIEDLSTEQRSKLISAAFVPGGPTIVAFDKLKDAEIQQLAKKTTVGQF